MHYNSIHIKYYLPAATEVGIRFSLEVLWGLMIMPMPSEVASLQTDAVQSGGIGLATGCDEKL